MRYINTSYNGKVETIDQFDTFKEAYQMLKEYRLSDPSGNYYISQRCTREWKNS